MISIDEIPEIICPVRIYENDIKIFEGNIKDFDPGTKCYFIDYISTSLSYKIQDKSESVDIFSVNAFLDIYVY